MREELERARRLLDGAHSIAVITHERPDGDAVGSMLGLVRSLRLRGAKARAVVVEGMPRRFRFLPGALDVDRALADDVDLWIAVDCAAADRAEVRLSELPQPGINIDHHPTNERYAQANLVDPSAAATAELLVDVAPALRLPIDQEVATNYLAGLLTDTLGFRTDSVTPKVFRVAGQLLGLGAPLPELYHRTLGQHTLPAVRYWASGLARVQHSDGLFWTSLTAEDRRRAGYPGADDADLINFLTRIEGAEVVVLFVEQEAGKVKVSWRTRPGLDVAQEALKFGGGGHTLASGAVLEGDLESVQRRVLSSAQAALASHAGSAPA
jgi:phosphoesterase RecJ-like protein